MYIHKSIVFNFCYAIRDIYTFKAQAEVKCRYPYCRYIIRQSNTCQLSTSVKCTSSNFCPLARYNKLSNCTCQHTLIQVRLLFILICLSLRLLDLQYIAMSVKSISITLFYLLIDLICINACSSTENTLRNCCKDCSPNILC